MENEKEKTSTLSLLRKVFKQVSFYITLILLGIVSSSIYFENNANQSKAKVFKAGEVSVSINEHSELAFLNRDRGTTVIVDSTLTEIINNMLAAREYVRVNKIR